MPKELSFRRQNIYFRWKRSSLMFLDTVNVSQYDFFQYLKVENLWEGEKFTCRFLKFFLKKS